MASLVKEVLRNGPDSVQESFIIYSMTEELSKIRDIIPRPELIIKCLEKMLLLMEEIHTRTGRKEPNVEQELKRGGFKDYDEYVGI